VKIFWAIIFLYLIVTSIFWVHISFVSHQYDNQGLEYLWPPIIKYIWNTFPYFFIARFLLFIAIYPISKYIIFNLNIPQTVYITTIVVLSIIADVFIGGFILLGVSY